MTRFWELGLGSLLAVLDGPTAVARLRPRLPDRWRPKLSMLGVALICAAAFLFDSRMAFPGWAALLPAAGAVCVLSGVPGTGWQKRILAGGPLVFVGVISYPLYLWHWPLLSFATILGSGSVPAVVRAAAVLVSFILAYLVFRFVEQPIRVRPELPPAGCWPPGWARWELQAWPFSPLMVSMPASVMTCAISRPHRGSMGIVHLRLPIAGCSTTARATARLRLNGVPRRFPHGAVYEGIVSLVDHGDARHPMLLLARGGCPPMLGVGSDASDAHRSSCDRDVVCLR